MEGAVRVFAGDYCQATLSVPDEDDSSTPFVVTPGGAWCRLIFIAGALMGVTENGDVLRARVADPTGGFDLVIGGNRTDLCEHLRKIPVPSFVTVLGRAHVYQRNRTTEVSVRPEQVLVIDRAVRDRWILGTAAATLHRIELLRIGLSEGCPDTRIAATIRHYAITNKDLADLASMVEGAVKNVRPEAAPSGDAPDIRALVIELIGASKGPRGIEVQEILDTLTARGFPQQGVLAAIESLIQDDECYQPQKGFVRLL